MADVEQLPFEDGRFDCCASVFGAMFAPRPEVAAAEMFRVVRAGRDRRAGVLGAGWLPGQGVRVRQPVRADARRVCRCRALWGDEDVARERLSGLASSVAVERHMVRHEYDSPEGWFEFSSQRRSDPGSA